MRSFVPLVVAAVAIVGNAGVLNDCAGSCVGRAIGATSCSSTNSHCICASPDFMTTIQDCVSHDCDAAGRESALVFASDFCETVSTVKPDLRRRSQGRRRSRKTRRNEVVAREPEAVETRETLEATKTDKRASPQNGPYWWDANYPWPPQKGQYSGKPWWWPSNEAWPPTNRETLPTRPWWWPQNTQWPPAPGVFPSRPQWWPAGKVWPPPYVNTATGTISATATVTATVY